MRLQKTFLQDSLLVFGLALFVVTLFSQCSPLYPFQTWVDAHCYFTVGKSVLVGKVPYKDLIDHKGLLLFFLQTIGAAVSWRSFIGVYLLEVLAAFGFLRISLRAIRLHTSLRHPYLLLGIIALLTYASVWFAGGDSAEEFCLPLLAYGLYVTIKHERANTFPARKTLFLMGVAIGCILWIKFTILGLYLGIYAYWLVRTLRQQAWKNCWLLHLYFFLGLALISMLCLFYCWQTDSWREMFDIYFYRNIFGYQDRVKQVPSLFVFSEIPAALLYYSHKVHFAIRHSYALTLLFFIGLGYYLSNKKTLSLALFFGLSGALVGIFVAPIVIVYYLLALVVFFPFLFSPLWLWLERRVSYKQLGNVTLLSLVVALWSSPNLPLLFTEKKDNLVDRCCEHMKAFPSPKILLYGEQDRGLFTYTGTIPPFPYFCKTFQNTEGILKAQAAYIEKGEVDFILAEKTLPVPTIYTPIDAFTIKEGRSTTHLIFYQRKELKD